MPRMMQQTITLSRDTTEAERVRAWLDAQGFRLATAPYALFRAAHSDCTVTFYCSGKVVFQGAGADAVATELFPERAAAAAAGPYAEALALHPSPPPEQWIGIDETGKGDYFGPLVVVAAAVRREHLAWLAELGVADSKTLSDSKIRAVARDLRAACVFAAVIVMPERYNELYERIGNLNDLLAWGHARALEDALTKAPECTYAISDKFATSDAVVARRLQERGRAIRLDQRPRAEADPAVAAASMLSRDIFLRRMEDLGANAGMQLPRGAGAPVVAAAREIVRAGGRDALGRVAKLHFSITERTGGG
ncbi:MAG: ribonuclease HIII [Candidatus Schekmanbacteria bacterium]|nr:ribonuclease HIII [Candidatus Schekmanbacteria bacterium]